MGPPKRGGRWGPPDRDGVESPEPVGRGTRCTLHARAANRDSVPRHRTVTRGRLRRRVGWNGWVKQELRAPAVYKFGGRRRLVSTCSFRRGDPVNTSRSFGGGVASVNRRERKDEKGRGRGREGPDRGGTDKLTIWVAGAGGTWRTSPQIGVRAQTARVERARPRRCAGD